jgi:hypothetical protein
VIKKLGQGFSPETGNDDNLSAGDGSDQEFEIEKSGILPFLPLLEQEELVKAL